MNRMDIRGIEGISDKWNGCQSNWMKKRYMEWILEQLDEKEIYGMDIRAIELKIDKQDAYKTNWTNMR